MRYLVIFAITLVSQVLITELDFRWPLATKTLKYLNEASLKCGLRILVAPSPNSTPDLVAQRVAQAFKRRPANIELISALPKFLKIDRSENYVMSPLFVLETFPESHSSKQEEQDAGKTNHTEWSYDLSQQNYSAGRVDSSQIFMGCFALEELGRLCQEKDFLTSKTLNGFNLAECQEKIFKGAIDNTFKFFYLMVMFVLLSLTVLLAFFW